jgi:acetyl esterase
MGQTRVREVPVPLHPQSQSVVDAFVALGLPEMDTLSPGDARALMASRRLPVAEVVHEVRDLRTGNVPCRLYRPSDDPNLPLLVYLHGGGWVCGSVQTHDEPCRYLANLSGCAVLSVDYRLAPEHKFPVPLDDCVTALRWAHEHAREIGADPSRIALGGDSAGGNLAISAAMTAGIPLRFLLLAYPCTDLRLGSASVSENSVGPFLTESLMRWFVAHYLDGATEPEDPLASPLLAPDELLAALPPSLVLTAQYDVLRDEGEAFGHRLASLGVASTVIRFPGQYHGFFGSPSILDDALAAHRIAATMLGRHLA